MTRTPLLFASLFLLYVHQLEAATIYETDPFTAEGGALARDFATTPLTPGQVADNFFLAPPSQITAIDWWGLYFMGNTPQSSNDFTIRIFAHSGGHAAAGTPLFEHSPDFIGQVDTGVGSFEYDVYSYSADLPSPLALEGGRTYWLSIVNDTQSDSENSWYWQRSDRFDGTTLSRFNDERMWLPEEDTGAVAFRFRSEIIPEPSVILLCRIGVASATLVRRRR